MARTVTVTPRVQTARPREKTFTLHPLETRGSLHLALVPDAPPN